MIRVKKIFSRDKVLAHIDDKSIRPSEFLNHSYDEIVDILKKETTEFVRKRSEELRFREHREYLQKTMHSVKRSIKDFAKEKGPQYIGAFTEMNAEHRHYFTRRWYNQHVFGLTSWRNSNRITYPTLRIGLYNLKEE